MSTYVISPSELSYICEHCNYLNQNYGLKNSGVSAGVTQTLDGMQKDYFLGDCKKISDELPEGKVIDPYNLSFFSKELVDNNGRKFRLKGKCDALVKYDDGSTGIIDYKTSKFEKKDSKDYSFKEKDLLKKAAEYTPQIQAYHMLYANLETDENFLKNYHRIRFRVKDNDKINRSYYANLAKIDEIKINSLGKSGLVFIYPKELKSLQNLDIQFTFKFIEVDATTKKFMELITNYLQMLNSKNPPEPPESCAPKDCGLHKKLFDKKQLSKFERRVSEADKYI